MRKLEAQKMEKSDVHNCYNSLALADDVGNSKNQSIGKFMSTMPDRNVIRFYDNRI